MTNQINLYSITLSRGPHRDRTDGVCLMEAVAWMAGEPHTDQPACVDPALAAFGRVLNDRLRDDERQHLLPLIPLLVGTARSRALSVRRAYHLVDRHVRHVLPALLRGLLDSPRPDVAARLEALDPMVDKASAQRAHAIVRELCDQGCANDDTAAVVYAAGVATFDVACAQPAATRAARAATSAADAAADAFDVADVVDLRAATIARSIAVYREAIDMR